MKKIILFTIILLSLCSILLLLVYRETPEENLAYRMSRSEYFPGLVKWGERMADQVESMPDSTKDQLRQSKEQINKIQSSTTLNTSQKRDSIIKIIKSVSVLHPELASDSSTVISLKNFNNEFPEYRSLTKEIRHSVFKKAFEMYIENSRVRM